MTRLVASGLYHEVGPVALGRTGLRQLQLLCITDACLSDDENAAALAQRLAVLSQLTHLDVGRDEANSGGVSVSGLAALAQSLSRLTWLRHLVVCRNEMSVPAELSARLEPLHALSHLELSARDMAVPRAQLLHAQTCGLRKTHGLGALALCLPALTNLVQLRIGESGVTDADARALGPQLAQLQCLEHLALTHGTVAHAGARALEAGMAHLARLTCIELQHSSCSNWILPCVALPECPEALAYFDASGIVVGPGDAQALAERLACATGLAHLYLPRLHKYGRASATLILRAISKLQKLVHLSFGPEAQQMIVQTRISDHQSVDAWPYKIHTALTTLEWR